MYTSRSQLADFVLFPILAKLGNLSKVETVEDPVVLGRLQRGLLTTSYSALDKAAFKGLESNIDFANLQLEVKCINTSTHKAVLTIAWRRTLSP